jgi:hypothetical protein
MAYLLAAEFRTARAEHMGVGFQDTEQFRFRRRPFGKPPAEQHIGPARTDCRREMRTETDSSLRRTNRAHVPSSRPNAAVAGWSGTRGSGTRARGAVSAQGRL